jgi:mannose-6-phosphate isomerase
MAIGPLYPLTFHPIFKERVWGGRRLQDLYDKALPPHVPVGESWEISDRPGDVSVIANGALAGIDLHWLAQNRASELMGSARLYKDRFPFLVKILDARETLSLQVHPPAARATKLGGEPKTEFWFVADAAPDAEIFVGLKAGCTREEFVQKIHAGTVASCLHRVRVHAGDAVFLPSGRVHALGAGTVIFEIQQNSDTTFRVFDWNRKGLDGKPRQLHVKESLESIEFDDFEPALLRPQFEGSTVQRASLVSHPLFTVEVRALSEGAGVTLESGIMHIIGVVQGTLLVRSGDKNLVLSAGQFCLIPSSVPGVMLRAHTIVTCLCVQPGEAAAL